MPTAFSWSNSVPSPAEHALLDDDDDSAVPTARVTRTDSSPPAPSDPGPLVLPRDDQDDAVAGQVARARTAKPAPLEAAPPAPGPAAVDRGYSRGGSGIFVRPYAGLGVPAEFDPESGALQASRAAGGPPDGVYSNLEGIVVVLYRAHGRLAVRISGQAFDLDDPAVSVVWSQVARRVSRCTILVDGEVAGEVDYRSVPAALDLGLLIRNTWADPAQRASMFAH
ncbi:hypothetical protein AB0H76_37120 [Nocardia sp. NPDC050712]|uniref:hypothetical protein n=1 Tax=Nocardia sp. NPDC050712 TaxID=3155518 RepID=UPI0033F21E46